VRIVFSTAKFAKKFISRLKMEKKFYKEEKVSNKPILVGFFTKSNSSEQNIYRNRRLKIHFQRCCAPVKVNTDPTPRPPQDIGGDWL
jgi:hypothetical protein